MGDKTEYSISFSGENEMRHFKMSYSRIYVPKQSRLKKIQIQMLLGGKMKDVRENEVSSSQWGNPGLIRSSWDERGEI